jgi:hypothetical protein
MTAMQMAEHLKVEKFKVVLFCQVNLIQPAEETRRRKKKDDYHIWKPKGKVGSPKKEEGKEPIRRPPAVYSNRNRIQTIEHYENLKVA